MSDLDRMDDREHGAPRLDEGQSNLGAGTGIGTTGTTLAFNTPGIRRSDVDSYNNDSNSPNLAISEDLPLSDSETDDDEDVFYDAVDFFIEEAHSLRLIDECPDPELEGSDDASNLFHTTEDEVFWEAFDGEQDVLWGAENEGRGIRLSWNSGAEPEVDVGDRVGCARLQAVLDGENIQDIPPRPAKEHDPAGIEHLDGMDNGPGRLGEGRDDTGEGPSGGGDEKDEGERSQDTARSSFPCGADDEREDDGLDVGLVRARVWRAGGGVEGGREGRHAGTKGVEQPGDATRRIQDAIRLCITKIEDERLKAANAYTEYFNGSDSEDDEVAPSPQ